MGLFSSIFGLNKENKVVFIENDFNNLRKKNEKFLRDFNNCSKYKEQTLILYAQYGLKYYLTILLTNYQSSANNTNKYEHGDDLVYLQSFKKLINIDPTYREIYDEIRDYVYEDYRGAINGRVIYDCKDLIDSYEALYNRVNRLNKVCPSCGKELNPNASFCIHCGYNLVENKKAINKNDVVSKGELEEKDSQIAKLKSQKNSLQDDYEELNSKISRLKSELTNVKNENEELNSIIRKLKRENSDLIDKILKLESSKSIQNNKIEDDNSFSTCSVCGARIKKGIKFCTKCGAEIVSKSEDSFCPECGEKITGNGKYCFHCGYNLKGE